MKLFALKHIVLMLFVSLELAAADTEKIQINRHYKLPASLEKAKLLKPLRCHSVLLYDTNYVASRSESIDIEVEKVQTYLWIHDVKKSVTLEKGLVHYLTDELRKEHHEHLAHMPAEFLVTDENDNYWKLTLHKSRIVEIIGLRLISETIPGVYCKRPILGYYLGESKNLHEFIPASYYQ